MKYIMPERSILRINIIILFLILTNMCLTPELNAQGWGFTFQLSQSGPCGSSIPYIQPFTIPSGIPTQGQCNSLRQTILGISASQPVYDNHGNYLGECKVFYTCTECTGSDIINPTNSSAPGSVSVNGLTQGNAFFTPHESEALQKWLEDYLQRTNLMAMPGTTPMTIDLKKDVPLTGDNDFNKYYIDQMLRFEKPEQGGVVDLSGKKGIIDPNAPAITTEPAGLSEASKSAAAVPLFRDPDEAKIEEQFRTHFSPLDPDRGWYSTEVGNVEQGPFVTTEIMIELANAALGIPIGLFIEGTAGYVVIPVTNLVFEDIKAGVQLARLISGENVVVPSTTKILANTAEASAYALVGKFIDDKGIGKLIGNKLGQEAMEIYGKSPGIVGSAVSIWQINKAKK